MVLPSQLPIFEDGVRQMGLYATRQYNIGEYVTPFFGLVKRAGKGNKESGFKIDAYTVIDPSATVCKGQYVNATVPMVFPCNVILVKKQMKFKTTKEILPGEEFFLRYGWGDKKFANLIKPSELVGPNAELAGDVLFRGHTILPQSISATEVPDADEESNSDDVEVSRKRRRSKSSEAEGPEKKKRRKHPSEDDDEEWLPATTPGDEDSSES